MGFVLDVNHSSCRDLTLWNWMIPIWMVLNIGCGEGALFCWTPRFSRQILWTMRPKWLTWSVCGSHSSCPLGCFQWYPLAVLDRCNWQLGRPSVPLRPSTGNSMRWEKKIWRPSAACFLCCRAPAVGFWAVFFTRFCGDGSGSEWTTSWKTTQTWWISRLYAELMLRYVELC